MTGDQDLGAVGCSEEGRPIRVRVVGPTGDALRVLVLAGQHGDERPAREALTRFLESNRFGSDDMHLAAITDANPDGSLRRQRHNARGIDLNRDHLRLDAAETRAVHGFVRQWQPHLIIDMHNYPARRRRLVAAGYVRASDLCVATSNHPAIDAKKSGLNIDGLQRQLEDRLHAIGCGYEEYVVLSRSGRARHSTRDIRDARNGLALRYGVPSVLLEGRMPTRRESAGASPRLIAAQCEALRATLTWAIGNREQLLERRRRDVRVVPVRWRSTASVAPVIVTLRNITTGRVEPVAFRDGRSEAVPAGEVELPYAYAVPHHSAGALAVLRRHGIVATPVDLSVRWRVERAQVLATTPSRRPTSAPRRIDARTVVEEVRLSDVDVFRVAPETGRFLAVVLELRSRCALHRYGDSGLTVREGEDYPVLRLLPPVQTRGGGG